MATCSFCKRELFEKAPGPGCAGGSALVRGSGILGASVSELCVANRLTGLVYAQSRIGGISKIIRLSPVACHKS
jgi:hypothetical protein